MRWGVHATFIGLVGLLTVQGCGGGSSSSTGGNNSLTFRAQWQQSATAGSAADANDGAFGSIIPRAAKTVVVLFEPSAGARRCIAVDPLTVPIDPVVGQRILILHGLPSGPANVTLFGFPTAPDHAREVCEGSRLGTPSFRSDPHPVTIIAAQHNDAGDIKVYALPFLIDLNPDAVIPPASFGNSTRGSVTIADAATGVRSDSINVLFRAGLPPGQSVPTTLAFTPCADGTSTPCSSDSDLEVDGFIVTWTPASLPAGVAQVEVMASNLDTPMRTVDFSYNVVVPPSVNPGTLTGTVINCLTGAPLAATVTLTEPEARQTSAGSDGRFSFSALALGDFRVDAVANGFNASEISGTLTLANPTQDVTLPLCPPIALRTVLTWGSGSPAPQDLDAHLRGPAPGTLVADAPVEFHLFFTNRDITFPTGGHATLDIDSRNFSGPETQSVTELAPGQYRYCVHDFSDRTNPATDGFTRSGARVQVFLNDQQVGEFPAPVGLGNVWEVFQLDTTQQPPQVVPINQLGAESQSERVCHGLDDPDGDGLTNAQEAVLGTDPNISDTNGNGVSDGQDVINGTNPLPPSTPTNTLPPPTVTPTPTPTATPIATATMCPPGTPTESARGAIIIVNRLVVDATNDPQITLRNTANNMVHAQCSYANANGHCAGTGAICSGSADCAVGDTCAPGCDIANFTVTLARQQSLSWHPSAGASGIPQVPEMPFSGELFCVEVDGSGVPFPSADLVGSLTPTASCPIAATSVAVNFDTLNGDNILCLGGIETSQCPNGAEYGSCPANVDPTRIESCWSESPFIFVCGQ